MLRRTSPLSHRVREALKQYRHADVRVFAMESRGMGWELTKQHSRSRRHWQPALHKAQSILKLRQVFSLAPQGVLHHTSAQLSSHRTMWQCSSKLSARSFQLHQLLPLFSRHPRANDSRPDLFTIIHYVHGNSLSGTCFRTL